MIPNLLLIAKALVALMALVALVALMALMALAAIVSLLALVALIGLVFFQIFEHLLRKCTLMRDWFDANLFHLRICSYFVLFYLTLYQIHVHHC